MAHRLIGDIALARKQYPAAIDSYRAALQRAPDTEGALRLYRALLQSGTVEKANDFIASWLKSRPDDLVAARALAEGRLRAGNRADARSLYEEILKRTPDEPDVLNNLANILLAQGNPAALDYAERAHRLAPNDASVQDTLGWTLVQQGQVDAGLRHLRDARLRAPHNAEIRYHLAAALVRAGRAEEARKELQPVLASLASSPSGPEARKLAQELGL
jgi:tetratricopeptide (TPR) repeat protein